MLSQDNLIQASRSSADFDHLSSDEEVLAYLPMAWVGDNVFRSDRPMSEDSVSTARKIVTLF